MAYLALPFVPLSGNVSHQEGKTELRMQHSQTRPSVTAHLNDVSWRVILGDLMGAAIFEVISP